MGDEHVLLILSFLSIDVPLSEYRVIYYEARVASEQEGTRGGSGV